MHSVSLSPTQMKILVKSSEFEEEVDIQANDRNCTSKPPVPSIMGNLTCSSSVCDAVKNTFHTTPEKTIFDAKQLLGHKMDDLDISVKLSCPSRLRRVVSRQPMLRVRYRNL